MSSYLPGGQNFSVKIPEGDNRERMVCGECGWVNYVNPKIVVGAVCRWQEKILLCRRAIEPRKGYWTIPAGFMEERETTAEGAAREAMEEANAQLRMGPLLAVYNIPRISQVQMIYKADLISPDISAGIESLEVGFFDYDDIPWDDLAFPSVTWALEQAREVWDRDDFVTFTNPPGDLGFGTPA